MNQKTLHSTQTSSLNSSVSSTKTAAKLQSIVLNKRVKQCKGNKFCHVNLNSVRNKFEEVYNFLTNHHISVFAITESYLDPDRDLSSTFQIPSYQTLRMDRESCCGKKSGGGLLIYIHEYFNYDVIDFNFKLPGRVQILIVKVYCEFTKPIIVSVVYNPPDTDKSEFLNCFINLNTFLSTFKFEKLIVGDLNVNLIRKGNVFDIVAHKLLLLAREFNLSQIIKGPTHNASSLLDHMYVSDKDKFQNVFHFPFAGSDHDLCIVAFKKKHVKFPPRVIQCRDLKSIDWDIFNEDISDYTLNISKINNNVPSSVDEEFSNFNTHVMNVFDKHAPCSKKLVKSKHLPWFNNEICKLIKDRNRLLHKARKTNNLSDLKLYRTARNLVNYSMVKAKKKYFLCKFEKVTKSTCSMWKCIDELTGYTKKDSKPLSSLMVNNVYTNDKVKINDNLADSFVVNGSFQSISNDECDKAIKNYCENYDYSESRTNDYMPIDIKTFEVEGSISKIKNKQAKNVLMPTITVIKKCKNTFSEFLSLFFTCFINQCILPQSFKSATVTPLYKGKGSRCQACNYRPISILNVYCKIFERFLFNRMMIRIENKLCKSQHGYKKNKSCITAIKEFTNFVYESIDQPKTKVVAIMCDFSQAFNSIEKNVLLSKLMNDFKFEPWYICIVREIFRNRVFRFKNDNKYYEMSRGTCQGSVLGGLFYSLYSDNLSSRVSCNILSYADDVILYAKGTDADVVLNDLIMQLESVCEWCDENGIKLNFAKTKFMIFHKEHDKTGISDKLCFEIRNETIERVNEFKYLGNN